MYNLTPNQKELLRWLVQQIREGRMKEEFSLVGARTGISILGYIGHRERIPAIEPGALQALAASQLIIYEDARQRCTLLGKAYEAVDSDFSSPDTSFIKYLTPLADIMQLDDEIKRRCLPIVGAGSGDAMLWDSASRTAGVILEERMRDVGGIQDHKILGRDLANALFKEKGTLASKFTIPSEREGYRDLFAGIVGVFRNPNAHRLIDPSPEEGGAFIVFVDLLLKKLEALR